MLLIDHNNNNNNNVWPLSVQFNSGNSYLNSPRKLVFCTNPFRVRPSFFGCNRSRKFQSMCIFHDTYISPHTHYNRMVS